MKETIHLTLCLKVWAICVALVLTATTALSANQAPVLVGGEEEIRDIQGPIAIPLFTMGEWVALALLALILGIGLSWVFVRSLRRKAIEPPPSPRKWALQEIEAVSAFIHRFEDREFCTALSDTVRCFIERELAIPALEITTEEFFAKFSKHAKIPNRPAQTLEKFLGVCDQVKFAQYTLDISERRALIEEARSIVVALNNFKLQSKEHGSLDKNRN